MRFTVGEVTWEDGRLSGPDEAVLWLELTAMKYTWTVIGPPTGPCSGRNHLQQPECALMLMRETFPGAAESGEIPDLGEEDLPLGVADGRWPIGYVPE